MVFSASAQFQVLYQLVCMEIDHGRAFLWYNVYQLHVGIRPFCQGLSRLNLRNPPPHPILVKAVALGEMVPTTYLGIGKFVR